jgi:hypothetical protein
MKLLKNIINKILSIFRGKKRRNFICHQSLSHPDWSTGHEFDDWTFVLKEPSENSLGHIKGWNVYKLNRKENKNAKVYNAEKG